MWCMCLPRLPVNYTYLRLIEDLIFELIDVAGINKMIADGHYTDAYPLHEVWCMFWCKLSKIGNIIVVVVLRFSLLCKNLRLFDDGKVDFTNITWIEFIGQKDPNKKKLKRRKFPEFKGSLSDKMEILCSGKYLPMLFSPWHVEKLFWFGNKFT